MNARKIPSSLWLIIVFLIAIGGVIFLAVSANRQTVESLTLPLTVTEYFDYNCSHCIDFYPFLNEAKTKYGDQIEVTYMHYPFINSESYTLAYAAEAAREQ